MKETKLQQEASKSYDTVWQHVETQFSEAIHSKDIDEAHRLWCLASELWLFLSQKSAKGDKQGLTDEGIFCRKSMPRRGIPMLIMEQDLVRKVEETNDAHVVGIDHDS